MSEPLGDGADQPFLLLQKGSAVLGRSLLGIPHAEPAHHFFLDENFARLNPRGGSKVLVGEDLVAVLDHGSADVGVLPSGWDHLHHLLECFRERQIEASQDPLNLVQAVELLRAFLEGGDQLVGGAGVARGLSHGGSLLVC